MLLEGLDRLPEGFALSRPRFGGQCNVQVALGKTAWSYLDLEPAPKGAAGDPEDTAPRKGCRDRLNFAIASATCTRVAATES